LRARPAIGLLAAAERGVSRDGALVEIDHCAKAFPEKPFHFMAVPDEARILAPITAPRAESAAFSFF
jgi:hypothetical protein